MTSPAHAGIQNEILWRDTSGNVIQVLTAAAHLCVPIEIATHRPSLAEALLLHMLSVFRHFTGSWRVNPVPQQCILLLRRAQGRAHPATWLVSHQDSALNARICRWFICSLLLQSTPVFAAVLGRNSWLHLHVHLLGPMLLSLTLELLASLAEGLLRLTLWVVYCRGTPPSIVHRVDVIGISCYSSADLINWDYEGTVLLFDR